MININIKKYNNIYIEIIFINLNLKLFDHWLLFLSFSITYKLIIQYYVHKIIILYYLCDSCYNISTYIILVITQVSSKFEKIKDNKKLQHTTYINI